MRTTCRLLVTVLIIGLVAAQAQVQTYTCTAPGGFGPVVAPIAPAALLNSLKTVPNPVFPNGPNGAPREDLLQYIANMPAAIQLGKALFWEMQAGSDNKTACATCHFRAGQDGRTKNQLQPGPNGNWDGGGVIANYDLQPSDFPFTLLPSHDTDNIAGSQGVRKSKFGAIGKTGVESVTLVADPVFSVGGVNVRQVTGKNTPSAINAVFNHRNFFDGRAQPEFNGVTPWGARDGSSPRVWVLGVNGIPSQIDIRIQNASLASQAVGPPLNTVEMSAAGRTFPDIGRKLLLVKPLGLQRVASTDSVLGPLADVTTGKGLTVTYSALIQKAFQPKWWNYSKKMPSGSYTMMEANFSLYWGLSIMLYEATLTADSSPMDQYLLTRVVDPVTGLTVSHDPTKLDPVVSRLALDRITAPDGRQITTADILNGLALFELPVAPPPSFPVPAGFGVGCIGCHTGAETTSASIRNLTGPGVEAGDVAFKNAGFDLRMERMFMKLDWTPPGPLTPVPAGSDTVTFDSSNYATDVTHINTLFNPAPPALPLSLAVATYDTGWYNLGVRPTSNDPGLGGVDAFGKPLSWTQLFQTTLGDPTSIKVPGNGLGCAGAGNVAFPNELLNATGFPLLSGPLHKTEATDVAGSFKVPGLRNVELNGPYFHNGGKSTLAQVVDFYDGGGDFTNSSKAPAIVPLLLTQEQSDSLVAFLLALTDDRVRLQQAPFDHPQLQVANGDSPAGTDAVLDVPAVGASGSTVAVPRFLNLNPFLN